MNKNILKRNIKTESILMAIARLSELGVKPKEVTNKRIVEMVDHLFSEEKERKISVNTLSKQIYYKDNIPQWIEEIYGIESNNGALEKAKKKREEKYKKKLERIERYGNELIENIVKGQEECDNFTKKFVRDWVVTNKGEEISETIFSSTNEYKKIFNKFLTKFYQGEGKLSLVNVREHGKLQTELNKTKKQLNDVISNIFISENDTYNPMVDGDGNEFKNITLKRSLLVKYLSFTLEKLEKIEEINAYQLFKDISKKCSF